MPSLSLTMATGKHERARPLAEGRVKIEGVDLTTLLFKDNGERHERFMAGEFDAAEISFANYLRSWSQDPAFAAIPVFFNRQFRHSSIYINADAGIREPRDLNGKRIGILSWFNTAALWARGALQHEYGLDITTVRWATGDPRDLAEATLPSGLQIAAIDGSSLVLKLLAGELDALITPRTPSRDHAPRIVRLFPDYRTVEEAYYRTTGVYPTSHALVVRKALLERHPWLAGRLFTACCDALRLAAEYADDPEHSTLAWYGAQSEYETAVFGPGGVTHGIEPNRKTLEMLVTYGHSAGLLPHRPAIEELFHSSARALAVAT